MNVLFSIVDHLGRWMARLTMVLLGVMVVLIVADVTVRTIGLRPLAWASSTAEYILLYAAFLPMPFLVRGKGHVFVEFLRAPMSPRMRRFCERSVYVACILICIYLAWVATASGWLAWSEGSYETKTFDMPKWLVFLPMALGFWLAAIEWLRFLLGADSLYDIDPLKMDGY
ncbi:MAG: TRAP transporter small permease [Rhodoferax sp.]|nr:TRAP transporter small permease [Rhodoferax sp.]